MRTAPAISVDIHFSPEHIRHKYHPADDKCHAYGVLKIDSDGLTSATLYFDTDGVGIDKAIAELVALKQEMMPPVITDSERTCPAVNDGWHCHRSGDHGVHQDDNGDEWCTDEASSAQGTAEMAVTA